MPTLFTVYECYRSIHDLLTLHLASLLFSLLDEIHLVFVVITINPLLRKKLQKNASYQIIIVHCYTKIFVYYPWCVFISVQYIHVYLCGWALEPKLSNAEKTFPGTLWGVLIQKNKELVFHYFFPAKFLLHPDYKIIQHNENGKYKLHNLFDN